jgi:hypothetical protein
VSAVVPTSLWREQSKTVRQHLEDSLQRAVCQFLDIALPNDAMYFAVPNGGKRHPKEAARMSGLGLKKGIPDLCIIWRGRVVFVELKAPRGVQSPAQRGMANKLVYCGAAVGLCWSVADVEMGLRDAGIPLRSRVAA